MDLIKNKQVLLRISTVFLVFLVFNGFVDGKYCETKAAFNLASVTPLWEEKMTATGCLSKSTSSRGEEVHALHLKEEEGWPTPKVVNVFVRPPPADDDQPTYSRPFILLLHAEFDVSWRLMGEGFANDTYQHIIVTRDSQVVENRGLSITIQRRHAGQAKHLIGWLNKRYGAVTSYAKMGGANNVYLNMQKLEDSLPVKCEMNTRKKVEHVKALLQDVVPVGQRQGCLSEGTVGETNRIVHVIKIHETNRDVEAENGKVSIDLSSAFPNRKYPVKDVALVIKANHPVEVVISCSALVGRLDIVTEGNVVTSSLRREISVHKESLPKGTEDLMSYAVDYFGPSFTFTELWRANSLRVFVDVPSVEEPIGQDDVREMAREPKVIQQKDMKSRRHQAHSAKKGPAVPKLKSKRLLRADDVIALSLKEEMAVECLPQHMRVSFPRASMEQRGFRAQDISLQDAHCSVTLNDTHWVLFAPFHFCGTKREEDREKIVYANSVRFPANFSGKLIRVEREDEEELELEEEREEEARAAALEFNCEYVHQGRSASPALSPRDTSATTTTLTAARGLFSLLMSRDPAFARPLQPHDYPLAAREHDTLYVESRLEAGSVLRVVTEECWLSESQEPQAPSVLSLIREGCPAGPYVRFDSGPPSAEEEADRFSFQLEPELTNKSKLFLQCKLGVCTSDKSHSAKWGLKLCIDPKDFCLMDSLRSYTALPRSTHHSFFSVGPFHVEPRTPTNSPRNLFAKIPFRQTKRLSEGGGGGERIDVRCTIPENPSVILLGLSTESVIGIAFASFFIGLSLSAVLYCIYMKTDPLRQYRKPAPPHHHSGFDLSGHSASFTSHSTSSSQAPMTTA